MEVGRTEKPALTLSLSPLSLALTPDPSPIGWASGAPRRGRKLRRDEASSDHCFSTRSGLLNLPMESRGFSDGVGAVILIVICSVGTTVQLRT